MNTESNTNAVAYFLRLSRPINFSPVQIAAIPFRAVITNRDFQRVAFSGVTCLALSAFYTGVFNAGHHEHKSNDSFTPVQWFEFPDYVPPVMDLLVEDPVPFGVDPLLSCPKNTEHLERAYDLRHNHLFTVTEPGVLSVVQQRNLPRLLRILADSWSGSSLDCWAAAHWLSSFIAQAHTDGGSNDFTGGEKRDHESHPITDYLAAMAMVNSTRLHISDEEPVSDWVGINRISIVVAFTVFSLLAKRSRAHPPTELARSDDDEDNVPRLVLAFLMNPKKCMERLFEDNSCTPYTVLNYPGDSRARFLEDAPAPDSFAARFDALRDALFSSQELQHIAGNLPRDLAGFIRFVVFGMAMFLSLGLRIMVFLVTGQLFFKGFKNGKYFDSTLAVELADDEALYDSYPHELVETPERQDIEPSEGISDSLKSTDSSNTCDGVQILDRDAAIQEADEEIFIIQPSSSTSVSIDTTVETYLAPVLYGEENSEDEGIVSTLVTEHPTSSPRTVTVDLAPTVENDEVVMPQPVGVRNFSKSSISLDTTVETHLAPVGYRGVLTTLVIDPSRSITPTDIVDTHLTEDDEVVVTSQPSSSAASSSAALPIETVETILAPVIEDEKPEVEDEGESWTVVNRRRGRGKGKATRAPEEDAQPGSEAFQGSVEPVSRPFSPEPMRKRGSRGHGRRGRHDE